MPKTPPQENLEKARETRKIVGSQTYRTRDKPLIERLRKLESDLGGRTALTDLIYTALAEGYANGEIEYNISTKANARKTIRELLVGRRQLSMHQRTYEAYEFAVNALESTEAAEVILAPTSDMRKLKAAIEADGMYLLIQTQNHMRLVTGPNHPAGKNKPVVDEHGPITLPTTPGDNRWRRNAVARLKRTNVQGVPVLVVDPFKGGQRPPAASSEVLSYQEQRRLAGVEQRTRHNQEQTAKTRALVEPLVSKLGSWESNRFLNELSNVILFYGSSRELDSWFNSKGPATQESIARALRRLHQGETLAESNYESLLTFFQDINDADDPVARYIELLRESKGLAVVSEEVEAEGEFVAPPLSLPQESIPAPMEKPVVAESEQVWREQKAAIREAAAKAPERLPNTELALQVLYQMVVGRDPTAIDREEVIALARLVAGS